MKSKYYFYIKKKLKQICCVAQACKYISDSLKLKLSCFIIF